MNSQLQLSRRWRVRLRRAVEWEPPPALSRTITSAILFLAVGTSAVYAAHIEETLNDSTTIVVAGAFIGLLIVVLLLLAISTWSYR